MCPRNIKEYNLKKILIIGGTLSENLLYIPAIKQIKNAFQDASIDIVVAPDSEEFVFENPLFSEYIILDKKKSMFGFIRRARRKRYDLIISFKDEFLAFFLRGKFKLSFFFKDFFSEKIFTYESERILNFLEPFLGEYEDKLNLSFNVSKKDRDDVDIILKSAELKNSDTLVVINPGHLPIKKRIDISHYLAVIKELVKIYDAKIILAGTAKDKKNLKKIKELIEEKNNVYDFSEKLNLGSFAALLEKIDLLITQDIVSMYISSAVESPLVAIFGPGNPYRYGPLRGKNFVIHSNLNCFPCDVNKKCKNNYLCLKKISPEQILKSSFLLIDEKNQPFLFEF